MHTIKADVITRSTPVVRLLWALAASLGLCAPGLAQAEQVHVAVAANFTAPMQKIATAFQQESGHTLLISSGATGKLGAQIRNGAPFQVLLAADDETPTKLEAEGMGVANSRFTYAIGRLVLWSASPQWIDGRPEVLKVGQFKHLALANPKLAPYGQAAMQTLDKLGLSTALQTRFVQGENIAQTYQFVASGNAELGFVALSQVMTDGQMGAGSFWLVPPSMHEAIRQDALLLHPGKGKPAALAFMQFLRSDKARAVIRASGYVL